MYKHIIFVGLLDKILISWKVYICVAVGMKSVGMAENAHTTDSEEIAFATGEFTQSEDERMVLDDCDYTTNAEQTEWFRMVLPF